MKSFLALSLFLGLSFSARAGMQIQASLSHDRVAVGQNFRLNISVESSETVSVEAPELGQLQGITVQGQSSSTQSQVSFINGKQQMKIGKVFTFSLVANTPGIRQIPPAKVKVNNKVFKTNPLTVTVLSSGNQVPSNPQANRPSQPSNNPFSAFGFDDDEIANMIKRKTQLFQQLLDPPANPNEAFFIRAEVDKVEAYAGEQVTATWYIYTKGRIIDIDTLKYPSLRGFWKEDIKVATRLNFQSVMIEGQRYQRALLASFALFPIKPGTSTIDEYKAKCKVINMTAFGAAPQYTYTKSSKPIPITVKPLPEEGKPENFSGAVGRFEVFSKVKEQQIKTNEPLTWEVRFEGIGNAKLIDLPDLNLPEGVDIYDTGKDTKFFTDGRSYKKFNILLVPRKEGSLELPTINVGLFDPISGEYYEKTIKGKTLQVEKGQEAAIIASAELELEEQKKKEKLKKTYNQVSFLAGLPTLPPFYLWPVVLILLIFYSVYFAIQAFKDDDAKLDLETVFKDSMVEIQKDLSKEKWKDIGVKTTNTIYRVIGGIYDEGQGTVEELSEVFKKVAPSLRNEVKEPLEKSLTFFETLGFAPEEVTSSIRNKKVVKKQLKDVEEILKKAIKIGFKNNLEA